MLERVAHRLQHDALQGEHHRRLEKLAGRKSLDLPDKLNGSLGHKMIEPLAETAQHGAEVAGARLQRSDSNPHFLQGLPDPTPYACSVGMSALNVQQETGKAGAEAIVHIGEDPLALIDQLESLSDDAAPRGAASLDRPDDDPPRPVAVAAPDKG